MADTTAELTIKLVRGATESLAIQVPNFDTATVLQLKKLLEQKDPQQFPVAAQRLIFQGQILQDDKLLKDYNVESGCALHLTVTRAAAAAAPAATSAAAVPASAAASGANAAALQTLRSHLQQMRSATGFLTAVQTLQKVCDNIIKNPHEEKYRKLRPTNAALKAKVFDLPHGEDCVKLLGFQEGIEQGLLVLVPDAAKWETLLAGKRIIDEFAGASSAPFGGASQMPFNAFGGGAPDVSAMAAQAQAMLQTPGMMQQLGQLNPMVAQAMQNPALLQQQLQMLQQNPAMMQSIAQMMQNPQAMAQMQQLLGGGAGLGAGFGGGAGGLGGLGGMGSDSNLFPTSSASPAANPFGPSSFGANPFASATPPAAPAPAPAAASPSPASSTTTTTTAPSSTAAAQENDQVFDEAEIADAIARSLHEH